MKIGAEISAIAGLLFISIVSLSPFRVASAQSAGVLPKPTQGLSAESPTLFEARTKFVADPDADKYKLVFPTSYIEKIYKDPPMNKKERKKRERENYRWHSLNSEDISSSYRNSFIEELNKAGDQGYRLIAFDYPFVGIVRQGNVQYEYAGFEVTSWDPRGGFKENFERGYAQLAGQGFSVVDHVYLRQNCDYDRCDYDVLFLLEREKGVEIPRQYRLARHVSDWGLWGSGAELAKQINDYRALGFNPILAISRFDVLLQPATDKAEFSPVGTEVKVVTGFAGNVKKKVNELARQGFSLALTQWRIAVMYRNRDTTAHVSYIWLDSSKKKSFEQELARLQESGAIYRMTYGDEDVLIFEQPAADPSDRREYKVLKIQFQETENLADQRMDIDLTPSAKETINTLNSLVKEGFAVRDLFKSNPYTQTHDAHIVSVLLERTQ